MPGRDARRGEADEIPSNVPYIALVADKDAAPADDLCGREQEPQADEQPPSLGHREAHYSQRQDPQRVERVVRQSFRLWHGEPPLLLGPGPGRLGGLFRTAL
ncbi:hypothetical protein SUDANB171_00269 [Streptomyces sp. enrichment culture]